MSDEMIKKENLEVSDIAAVTVRLNGLLDMLSEFGYSGFLRLDEQGIPFVEADKAGDTVYLQYVMADPDEDRYVLNISRIYRKVSDAWDLTKVMMGLDTYNRESELGFLTFHPVGGLIEKRMQVFEMGGLFEPVYYKNLLESLDD